MYCSPKKVAEEERGWVSLVCLSINHQSTVSIEIALGHYCTVLLHWHHRNCTGPRYCIFKWSAPALQCNACIWRMWDCGEVVLQSAGCGWKLSMHWLHCPISKWGEGCFSNSNRNFNFIAISVQLWVNSWPQPSLVLLPCFWFPPRRLHTIYYITTPPQPPCLFCLFFFFSLFFSFTFPRPSCSSSIANSFTMFSCFTFSST